MLDPAAKLILPGQFEPQSHWYPRVVNATIHPLVHFFLHLKTNRIISRYCHLHPKVRPEALQKILTYRPKHYLWSGADLMNVTNEDGKRQMVLIENNSCPSGQKSMALMDEAQEQGGYRLLLERTVRPFLQSKKRCIKGLLAVAYDKNQMETAGYAHAMADVFNEPVYLASFYQSETNPAVKYQDGVMYVRDEEGIWHPIRAAFRYLTQRPWNRLPLSSKTVLFNPIITCLAGGRNKMIAAKAYDMLNKELEPTGLEIITPETIWDVSKKDIPYWVQKMGGQAVIKIPYSNAGQGVFTIVNQKELDDFMAQEFRYERFIVQSLIGNYHWSSTGKRGKLFHVGTMPNDKGSTFVADLRMMVSVTATGIRPLCLYARRAQLPLTDQLEESVASWDILGTNLSIKMGEDQWEADTKRLIIMERRDFNKMGMGLDDLIEAYIQTVLSMIAIDKMADSLFNSKQQFRKRLFQSLNDDKTLLDEILI
ncbi:MAG: hypothetical protein IPG32_21110 [Saprospirales bacterium]|nr:hypothetical protein [Saprospirales bacterium]